MTGLSFRRVTAARVWKTANIPRDSHFLNAGQAMLEMANGAGLIGNYSYVSPTSMATIKRQVYGDATRDVAEATSIAEVLLQESLPRPDVVEGITSFLEKRPPQFPSLSPTDA